MPETVQRFRCEDEAREALLAAAHALPAAGVSGSASLSLRWPRSAAAGMLAIAAPVGSAATAEAVSWVPLDSGLDRAGASGPALPPDWPLHRELLGRRSTLEAIVRCGPVFCLTLACSPQLREAGIPAFGSDGVQAGAGIRCAQPAGSDLAALAARVDEALGDRPACLLAGEGLVAVGPTLESAVATVAGVETLARVWWQLLQAGHRATDGVAA